MFDIHTDVSAVFIGATVSCQRLFRAKPKHSITFQYVAISLWNAVPITINRVTQWKLQAIKTASRNLFLKKNITSRESCKQKPILSIQKPVVKPRRQQMAFTRCPPDNDQLFTHGRWPFWIRAASLFTLKLISQFRVPTIARKASAISASTLLPPPPCPFPPLFITANTDHLEIYLSLLCLSRNTVHACRWVIKKKKKASCFD